MSSDRSSNLKGIRHIGSLRGLVALVALFWIAMPAKAQDQQNLRATFRQANAAFVAGNWKDAQAGYEKIAAIHSDIPAVYFNLGNTFFREGKTGDAILCYQRALQLNPRDANARANCLFAQKTAGLFPLDPPWWQKPFLGISLNGWTILATLCLWIACIAQSARFLLKAPRIGLRPLAWGGAFFFLVCVAGVAVNLPRLNQGVVVAENAPLRISPFEDASAPSSLPQGTLVKILKKHQGYYFVQSIDGKTGWLPPTQARPVIPEK